MDTKANQKSEREKFLSWIKFFFCFLGGFCGTQSFVIWCQNAISITLSTPLRHFDTLERKVWAISLSSPNFRSQKVSGLYFSSWIHATHFNLTLKHLKISQTNVHATECRLRQSALLPNLFLILKYFRWILIFMCNDGTTENDWT